MLVTISSAREPIGIASPPRSSMTSRSTTHSDAALFGEFLVVVITADVIGVSLYFQLQTGVPGNNASNFSQFLPCSRTHRILTRIEEDIRHIHDQTAGCVPSFQNQAELSQ